MLSPHARHVLEAALALLLVFAILGVVLRGAVTHPPDETEWPDRQW